MKWWLFKLWGGKRALGYLKVGVSLETNVFSTMFLYVNPAVYKFVVSLDKARDTKVMQDRSSYEVCKNEM